LCPFESLIHFFIPVVYYSSFVCKCITFEAEFTVTGFSGCGLPITHCNISYLEPTITCFMIYNSVAWVDCQPGTHAYKAL